ncbi:methyl-accepting chemotaxis protein [Paenibacillus popilliae]|uniref:Methyl-accepting chemotaxis protein n=1 Tax=Paenibacillus popilliae ATCC 14706 TaxID=1212764 RepID=M9M1Y2_PAEPP|nr:methyl-accepting chemotaxis protein [Paenibacillus popilliae]GAC41123.1 methyl-accepting chemotaxis protein [Paenibacillus popilliae ATCC 14706]
MKFNQPHLQQSHKKIGLQGAGLYAGAALFINVICFLLGLPVYAGLIMSLVLTAVAGYGVSMRMLGLAGLQERQASTGTISDHLQVDDVTIGKLLAEQGMLNYRELSEQVSAKISKMVGMLHEVKGSAELGFYVYDIIKEATHSVSADSNEQTEMIRVSSSTVSDVAAAIRHISVNADEATSAAHESSINATKGQESILHAIEWMEETNSTVQSLVEIMNRMEESSRKIVSFVSIIREIAEQTHLLALNAAIEAARFGDNGRGFSVIASEVRSLAEQSSQSAKQVTEVVTEILRETSQAVGSTSVVAEQVDDGLRAVNEAGGAFEFIKLSIGEVAGQMQEVSSSVEEIAAGTEQLAANMQKTEQIAVKATSEMNNVTQAIQEHHSIMQQISSTTESLHGLSSELELTLNDYRNIVHVLEAE